MGKHALPLRSGDEVVIKKEGFQRLLDLLRGEGYETVGPTIQNSAIVYDDLRSISDLPIGWHDIQDAGTYRLEKNDTDTLFGYVLGPHSWKKYLHPPEIRLWKAEREDKGFRVIKRGELYPRYAFIGVRPCEIEAMHILDTVFNSKEFIDSDFNSRYEKIFTVGVNCTRPGGTCFCASMNTGPALKSGFDIGLTEIPDQRECYFIAEAGSEKGAGLLSEIHSHRAQEKERAVARKLLEDARGKMGRTLKTVDLKRIFYEKFDHPRWERAAERCLTCGNCTMVCPTCFCYNTRDINALNGEYAERWRKWDSCFSRDFSYMHGGTIRTSAKSRYRQWLTHKLSTWVDQFGAFGCVGCGRCITWCPVGIDITEEAKAILGETAGSTP